MATKKTATKPIKPVASIVKKRSFLVPILAVLILIVVAVVVFFASQQAPQGTILATVNGEPIYLEDVDEEYARIPEQYREQISRDFLVNQSIDKKLLLQEAERRGIVIDDEVVDEQLFQIRMQFSIEEDQLATLLAAQNMTLPEYRELVREELLLAKVVDEAVLRRVSVTDQQIIDYYEKNEEEFSANGGAVYRHILVENSTLAEEIIRQLGEGESFEELAKEHSLDSSASSGGYLGIVTNESLVVEEFKEAALRLRTNQYSRAPVQSDYGYHIIMNIGTVEPYREVRERIRQQLELEKQKTAFNTFLTDLRANAEIKYYTTDGVVTEKRETTLLGFAACVGSKSTIYGTEWSPFTQEQLALFGDEADQLTYVDCDAKPHLCSAANIQKYPTWVIGGERYGKLSLKDLAEMTGCELE